MSKTIYGRISHVKFDCKRPLPGSSYTIRGGENSRRRNSNLMLSTNFHSHPRSPWGPHPCFRCLQGHSFLQNYLLSQPTAVRLSTHLSRSPSPTRGIFTNPRIHPRQLQAVHLPGLEWSHKDAPCRSPNAGRAHGCSTLK